MITIDKKATEKLIFGLKNNLNSDTAVREIVELMANPETSKYGPMGMNVEDVEKALIKQRTRYKLKDFIPYVRGVSNYVSRNPEKVGKADLRREILHVYHNFLFNPFLNAFEITGLIAILNYIR